MGIWNGDGRLWRLDIGCLAGYWRRVTFMFVICAGLGKGRLIDEVTILMNMMFCVKVLIVW